MIIYMLHTLEYIESLGGKVIADNFELKSTADGVEYIVIKGD